MLPFISDWIPNIDTYNNAPQLRAAPSNLGAAPELM